MAGASLGSVRDYVLDLFGRRHAAESPEHALLEAFLVRRDGTAFEAIVQRHGPMVLGVCRRLLAREEDVEDAFQATFLILARKAGTIRKRESLACWLHGVARRVACRARADEARRRRHERAVLPAPATDAPADPALRELRALIDDELDRLPEKYRAPALLCYLEGKTNEEAAEHLGWPVGTVKGRLSRARELLHGRLTRRGLALSAGAFATLLPALSASAPVAAGLTAATVQAALQFTASTPTPAA